MLALLLHCLALAASVAASSHRAPPLKRALHAADLSYTVLRRARHPNAIRKRQLLHNTPIQHDDSVLLSFGVADEDDFRIHNLSLILHPVHDLIHPNARIYTAHVDPQTGRSSTSEQPLLSKHHRVFHGNVVPADLVEQRWAEAQAGVASPDTHDWARLVIHSHPHQESQLGHNGLAFEGVYLYNGEMHHVRTEDNYERLRQHGEPLLPAKLQRRRELGHRGMVITRDRDYHAPLDSRDVKPDSCGHDNLDFNTDLMHDISNQQLFATTPIQDLFSATLRNRSPLSSLYTRLKRQGDVAGGNVTGNYINSIGQTTGCPKSAQIVYMGLAADCTYTAHYGSTDAARTQLLTDINVSSQIYQKTFNVSLGVIEMNVQDATCPSTASSSLPWNIGCEESGANGLNLNQRLSAFSSWRGTKGSSDGVGLWHLGTNCSSGSEVGVAWLGQLCRTSSSGSGGQVSSGTGVTAVNPREAQVMAHEIGHSFGAIHDCTGSCSLSGSCCPLTTSSCDSSSNFIMSPVSVKDVSSFSPCSVGNICTALGSSTVDTSCLKNPGDVSVISLQQCGNGILEPGEDCDPGANSTSTCCNPQTCKFTAGAVCDPSSSACCTQQCSYAPSSTVCRPALDTRCDQTEFCTGSSATCPADVTINDGTSCGNNGLACASGQCTSRDAQCATQGSSLGITQACSASSSCQVTCKDPSSSNSCIVLESNFIAGSPCGYAGKCRTDGSCEAGDWTKAAAAWYTRNLNISVPVTVVVGLLVLGILFYLIRCMVRGCRRRSTPASSTYMQAPSVYQTASPTYNNNPSYPSQTYSRPQSMQSPSYHPQPPYTNQGYR